MPGDRPCSCLLHGKHNGWQWKGRIVPWFVNKYIHSFKYLGLSSRSLWAPLKNHKASFNLLRTLGLGSVSKRVMRLWLEESVETASCWRYSALRSPIPTPILKNKLSIDRYLSPTKFSTVGKMQPTDGNLSSREKKHPSLAVPSSGKHYLPLRSHFSDTKDSLLSL